MSLDITSLSLAYEIFSQHFKTINKLLYTADFISYTSLHRFFFGFIMQRLRVNVFPVFYPSSAKSADEVQHAEYVPHRGRGQRGTLPLSASGLRAEGPNCCHRVGQLGGHGLLPAGRGG